MRIPTAAQPDAAMEALRWEGQPEAYRPDYARCLTGVMPTVLSLLGRGMPDPGPENGDAAAGASPASLAGHLPTASPRAARRVLLLVVDAFGFKELATASAFASLYGEFGTWITSVFPTITSTCLTSMQFALPPSRHGVAGHVVWRSPPGALVDTLRMQVAGARASLQDSGFDMGLLMPPGTLLGADGQADIAQGLARFQILNHHITGSGLSSLIHSATPLVGFADTLEGMGKAGRMLADMDTGWVGFYTELLDSMVHVCAGDGPEVGNLMAYLARGLADMAAAMPPRVVEETALVVVADHGQSTIQHRLPLYGDPQRWLEAHTRAVGHSGRTLHVTPRPGQEQAVMAWLRDYIGARGRVYTAEEVAPLCGPPSADPHWRAQYEAALGQIVAVLNPGHNWLKRDPAHHRGPRETAPYDTQLLSQHGGLGWDEMFVPLICAPLGALLDARP